MQISDLVGQYQSSTATAAKGASPNQGVERLVSTIRSLTTGNIFEGTITSAKNGQIVLGLSNGQQLSARLADKSISLSQGQSMFFQVKSNDGEQIQITPYKVAGTGANLTLISALSAAGLPMEADYLSMVNKMMEEQMPIDKNSLGQMAKLVQNNSSVDVQTLVEMKKLGIPITKEMVSQYENYCNDKQAIVGELDHYIDELPTAMSNEQLPADKLQSMNSQALAIITEGLSEDVEPPVLTEEMMLVSSESLSQKEPVATQQMDTLQNASTEKNVMEDSSDVATMADEMAAQEELSETVSKQQLPPSPHSLSSVLSKEQIQNLDSMLREVVWNTPEERMEFLKGEDSIVGVLNKLQRALASGEKIDKQSLTKLLSSPEFKSMIRDTLEQQWLIRPQDLANESDKINKLYEKLQNQMNRMEEVVRATGQDTQALSQMSTDIKSNVEFMNQINQAYTYVQIPLKMSGQNASGELYVYTNKKSLQDKDEPLSAFLHLDMDHLGATDVSVKMMNKEVNTKFYMESDEAYELVLEHWPILEKRLQEKGYKIQISVENDAKKVNFVDDFLKKDQPSVSQVKRYSFDIRA